MVIPMPTRLWPAVRSVVQRLASGDLDALERDGNLVRVTKSGLEEAIRRYGRTIVPLPDEALTMASAYAINGRTGEWALDIPIWTREEGQNDLTLSVEAIENENGSIFITIDDLRVQ